VIVGEPGQEATDAPTDEPTDEDDAEPEAVEPDVPGPERAPAEPEPAEPESDVAVALASFQAEIGQLSTRVAEVARLRTHDAELADRMHAEIVRLRAGELASAVAPMISQLLRLHDRMVSLSGNDDATVAGMLRIQLLQILDTTADVRPFTPAVGDAFDAARHQGAARVPTQDRSADGTVARTVKPGFQRGDGSVLRVAEVDVYRFEG
jgi:molecular chaperone GrpE (heat shock protein)